MNELCEDAPVAPGKIISLSERLRHDTFLDDIGVEFVQAGEGWCETLLTLSPRHLRPDGTVHSGVLSLLLEHTAELAGAGVVAERQSVRIVEIKANLLRPARGTRLKCRSQIVRHGSMTLGVGSEIYAHNQRQKNLVARALVTISITDSPL